MPGRVDWKQRIVQYGEVAPEELVNNPLNWRQHSPAQLEALLGSLEEFGWVQDVIVNRPTGRLIDGHARVLLAKKHHQPSVPVKYVSLTESEEQRLILVLDPISAMATANTEQLNTLLQSFAPSNQQLAGLVASLQAAATQALSQTTTTSEGSSTTTETETTGPELPANLDSNYQEQYGVIVICADEADQEATYASLQAAGYTRLKVVTT